VKYSRQSRPAIQGVARSAILYGLLVAFSSLFLLPVLWMISASLQDQQGVFASPYVWIPASPQWENYATVTTMFPFWRYLANTLLITLSVTTATLLSCSLVAYGFARLRFPGRDFLFALCLATMMLP
jgi:multiple sugar transport system permease protein